MTKQRLREIRVTVLSLTRAQFAAALRLSKNGHRTIARCEEGEEAISGPMAIAAEALASGFRYPQDRATQAVGFAHAC